MAAERAYPLDPLPFHGVARAWAVSVAEHLLSAYRSLLAPSMVIDDCWLTTEYALYVRHVRGDTRLGVRFGHLGINPTTLTSPIDSGQEGTYLYHCIYDTPPETKLTDRLGYGWWGDDPATGTWSDAVEHPRELTFRVPNARP
jgi:hypothetical protein